jgi:hypothetical protein
MELVSSASSNSPQIITTSFSQSAQQFEYTSCTSKTQEHVLEFVCPRKFLLVSNVVVVSTTDRSDKISALIAPEDGTVEEGSDRFYSVRMRCTLRVC